MTITQKVYAHLAHLSPGAAREWKLPMFAIATAKLGAHNLKLSFAPEGGSPVWSNQVAITVVK